MTGFPMQVDELALRRAFESGEIEMQTIVKEKTEAIYSEYPEYSLMTLRREAVNFVITLRETGFSQESQGRRDHYISSDYLREVSQCYFERKSHYSQELRFTGFCRIEVPKLQEKYRTQLQNDEVKEEDTSDDPVSWPMTRLIKWLGGREFLHESTSDGTLWSIVYEVMGIPFEDSEEVKGVIVEGNRESSGDTSGLINDSVTGNSTKGSLSVAATVVVLHEMFAKLYVLQDNGTKPNQSALASFISAVSGSRGSIRNALIEHWREDGLTGISQQDYEMAEEVLRKLKIEPDSDFHQAKSRAIDNRGV